MSAASPLKVLDLFSGIGGFSLGLERAGFETVAFCEISPKCRHLLATHWPQIPQFDDVCTLTAGDIAEPIDAICGGFPCQDISNAGKGAGLTGERSGLWREYARLVREFRPTFVIVENVAALLGRGLGDVLGDLAALGYDAWWDCVPASAVGAPHRRDRVWIVAYPGGVEHEGYGDALRREIAAGLSRAAAEQGVCSGHGGEAYALDPDADGIRPYRPRVHVHGDAELRNEQVGLTESLGGDVANADGEPAQPVGRPGDVGSAPAKNESASEERQRLRNAADDGCEAMADAMLQRSEGRGLSEADERDPGVHAQRGGSGERRPAVRQGGWWSAEPDVGRVAHGVPARVDCLHGLGNAVVPQIPEVIGRAILAAEAASRLERAA